MAKKSIKDYEAEAKEKLADREALRAAIAAKVEEAERQKRELLEQKEDRGKSVSVEQRAAAILERNAKIKNCEATIEAGREMLADSSKPVNESALPEMKERIRDVVKLYEAEKREDLKQIKNLCVKLNEILTDMASKAADADRTLTTIRRAEGLHVGLNGEIDGTEINLMRDKLESFNQYFEE